VYDKYCSQGSAQWILTAGHWEHWKLCLNVTQEIGNHSLTWKLFTIKMHIDFSWDFFCDILYQTIIIIIIIIIFVRT